MLLPFLHHILLALADLLKLFACIDLVLNSSIALASFFNVKLVRDCIIQRLLSWQYQLEFVNQKIKTKVPLVQIDKTVYRITCC